MSTPTEALGMLLALEMIKTPLGVTPQGALSPVAEGGEALFLGSELLYNCPIQCLYVPLSYSKNFLVHGKMRHYILVISVGKLR